VAEEVAEVPGVQVAAGVRFTQGREPDGDGTVTVVGIDPSTATQAYEFGWEGERGTAEDAVRRALGPDGALADAGSSVAAGRGVGDQVTLRTPTGDRVTYTIRGLLDEGEFGLLGGGLIIPSERVAEDFGERDDALVLVRFAPGENPRAEVDRLLATRFPNAESQDREELKDQQAGQINQLLGLIYVLLALSVIVSVFGIVNTLALSIYERTRELGLLRAIGTSRRQVRRMVRQESIITSLIGAVLGVVLGVIFALLISRPLEEEGFAMTFPVFTLLALLVIAAIIGTLAAIAPARRASRLDVLDALSYE
jgi:putative ABC transport system permease protein